MEKAKRTASVIEFLQTNKHKYFLTISHKSDNMREMRKTKTEFKQAFGLALREAFEEPIIITDHGRDSHVLITIEQYKELLEFKETLLAAEVLPTPQQKD